jgi:hypothetical protein
MKRHARSTTDQFSDDTGSGAPLRPVLSASRPSGPIGPHLRLRWELILPSPGLSLASHNESISNFLLTAASCLSVQLLRSNKHDRSLRQQDCDFYGPPRSSAYVSTKRRAPGEPMCQSCGMSEAPDTLGSANEQFSWATPIRKPSTQESASVI